MRPVNRLLTFICLFIWQRVEGITCHRAMEFTKFSTLKVAVLLVGTCKRKQETELKSLLICLFGTTKAIAG